MLLLDSETINQAEQLCRHFGAPQLLRQAIFKSSDTPQSYRQIDLLENAGLLPGEKDRKWRRFDVEDLVFLELILELRKFGFENSALDGLRRVCYGQDVIYQNPTIRLSQIELALAIVIAGKEIIVAIKPDGTVFLCSEGEYARKFNDFFPAVNIHLSDIVSRVTACVTDQKVEEVKPEQLLFEVAKRSVDFSEKGLEVIGKLMRLYEYESVTMKHGKADEFTLHVKKIKPGDGRGFFQVARTIQGNGYKDISFKIRDGVVMTYEITDLVRFKT
jgi:hypothetical protein